MVICLAACLTSFSGHNALAAGDPVVRVGLMYGSNALPGANLQNVAGTGYRFGFVDSSGAFIQLGSTSKSKISMVKNRNVFFNGSNYVDSASGVLVGAYHVDTGIQFPDVYTAQAEAEVRAAAGQNAFVCYVNGVYSVRINSYGSQAEASGAAASLGGVAVTGSSSCITVVETGTNTILFQFDAGNTWFTVWPSQGEEPNPITWFKNYKYRGMFDYRRMDGNDITVINRVNMDDYVKGVITAEMNVTWPLEALKAQALCAKSYAYSNYNRHTSAGFDVCATDHCQVYEGAQRSTAHSDSAVDAVTGQYILYNGQPIQAFFHSSNGGSTEDVTNVWTQDFPYLRAVADPYEDLSTATNGRWQYTVTNAMLTEILNAKGYNNGNVTGLSAVYTAAGNVYSLTFTFSNGGTKTFSKESARSILKSATYSVNTYSQRFTVSSGGLTLSVIGSGGTKTTSDAGSLQVIGSGGKLTNVSPSSSIIGAGGVKGSVPQTQSNGTYVISGTGWGHNVGMSQNGAKAMANLGMSCYDIINFYYTGVQIGYLY